MQENAGIVCSSIVNPMEALRYFVEALGGENGTIIAGSFFPAEGPDNTRAMK